MKRAAAKKVTGTICRNGPEAGTDAQRWSPHKWCLSPFSPRTRRSARGVSLMEVLISIFILTVGVLGSIALLPVGMMELAEANRSDRVAACGRAGLREIKVRRMLDPGSLYPLSGSFMIDPLGPGGSVAGTPIPRTPAFCYGVPASPDVFKWPDDQEFDRTTDRTKRPTPLGPKGQYTWAAMVTPSYPFTDPATGRPNCATFHVSIVVFYGRTGVEEKAAVSTASLGMGGGFLTLASNDGGLVSKLRANQWLLVVGADGAARWYRIISLGDPYGGAAGKVRTLDVTGPDWPPGVGVAAVVVMQSVAGVYSEPVVVDR